MTKCPAGQATWQFIDGFSFVYLSFRFRPFSLPESELPDYPMTIKRAWWQALVGNRLTIAARHELAYAIMPSEGTGTFARLCEPGIDS